MYREDKGTIVYVGGLPDDVKKEELEVQFEKFGTLNRVWVAFNPPGFAFIEFQNKEDAESAVKAMHGAAHFGTKLRVEVSRGRARGGRGGSSRGDRGSFRGDRGTFRGGRGGFRDREDFGGGRPTPYDRPTEKFRGMGGGGRFDDQFDERRRPEFPEREFEDPRGFGPRRDLDNGGYGLGRAYRDISPKGFGPGRDIERGFPPRDIVERDYPPRDIPGRDYPPSRDVQVRDYAASRDIPVRDYAASRDIPARDYPPTRDLPGRDYPPARDVPGRDYPPARDVPVRDYPPRDAGERGFSGGRGPRDYGMERDVNGPRGYGGGRDLEDFVPPRDVIIRDYGVEREVGLRRDGPVRDFAPPRDISNAVGGLGGRISDRFGPGPERGGFEDEGISRASRFEGRYSGDIGSSGDYGGGYGGRDRFRDRSPIPRGSRPIY